MTGGAKAARIGVLALMAGIAGAAAFGRLAASATSVNAGGAARVSAAPAFPDGRFRVVGSFTEELGGFPGTILAGADCPEPIGILSVRASYSAMAPGELRWRDGEYRAQYVYRGVEHDASRASFTLPASNIAYRALAAVGAIPGGALTQYLKVFVPAACPPLSGEALRQIEDALSG